MNIKIEHGLGFRALEGQTRLRDFVGALAVRQGCGPEDLQWPEKKRLEESTAQPQACDLGFRVEGCRV